MFKNIKHIIFDLGGVILNIDYQKTIDAFKLLGDAQFETRYTQLQQEGLFDNFETGKIDSAAFILDLKKHCHASVNNEQIIAAWNAMLLDIPLRRLQILQQLQLHFDTFLLSNTNSIHEEKFNQILKSQTGFNSFGVFFDKVYYSHHIGLRKPETAAFQLILDEAGFDATKTLFIDDSPQHVEGAKKLGIQTIWLKKGMTIEHDVFKPKISD